MTNNLSITENIQIICDKLVIDVANLGPMANFAILAGRLNSLIS
jgi:hypothetical protein